MMLFESTDRILREDTKKVVAEVRCKVTGTPYAYSKEITCTSIYEQGFANERYIVFYLEDEITFYIKLEKVAIIYVDGKAIW